MISEKREREIAAKLLQGWTLDDVSVSYRITITKARNTTQRLLRSVNPELYFELQRNNFNKEPGLKKLRQQKDKFLPALFGGSL